MTPKTQIAAAALRHCCCRPERAAARPAVAETDLNLRAARGTHGDAITATAGGRDG